MMSRVCACACACDLHRHIAFACLKCSRNWQWWMDYLLQGDDCITICTRDEENQELDLGKNKVMTEISHFYTFVKKRKRYAFECYPSSIARSAEIEPKEAKH